MSKNAPKSSLARVLIPLAAVMLGLLVILSLMRTGEPAPKDEDKQTTAQGTSDGREPAEDDDQADDGDDDTDNDDNPPSDPPDFDDPDTPPAVVTIAQADLTDAWGETELKVGDTVLSVDGKTPKNFADLQIAIATAAQDQSVELIIQRPGVEEPVTLNVAGRATKPTEEVEPEDQPVVVGPLENLRPAFAPTKTAKPSDKPTLYTLGSSDPKSGHELLVEINPYRAHIYRVAITNEYKDVQEKEQYVLLEPIDMSLGSEKYPKIGSYAANYITINGTRVKLWEQDAKTKQWNGDWAIEKKSKDSLTLALTIQGGPEDAPVDVVKITRTFSVSPGSHTVNVDQQITNLLTVDDTSDKKQAIKDNTLKVQWEQLAQSDVHKETNDYLRGRSMHFVTGYFKEDYDPAHVSVYVKHGFLTRPDVIGDLKDPDEDNNWESVWPIPKLEKNDETETLVWLASENRYFVAISTADQDNQIKETGDVTPLQSVYPTITTDIYPNVDKDDEMDDEDRIVLIGLVSRELTLKPGAKTKPADLSLDLFVGPREDDIFAQQPYQALRYDRTIRYSLGGFCGVCTFQWLAHLLLGFLELLHSGFWFIPGFSDWGISIILLVLVVRLCLHPLTKRGQINMMKMGKQMAAVQPELNKLKKKYADDPREMQQAQMQLFREKGINPAAGALGCMPMFLQMPIWIALYAMLYYAIELRHESAFYGIFQAIGNWPFLADLSSPDRFIPLMADDGSHIQNLIFIQFNYSSINILPILMGVTFFINMKFTTPPPMNEQQATQQKIMRIMPLLFPFFLYSAPAGLTLYICASTLAGIVDSYIVRKHVKELEESGELFQPKKTKPGGFMDRLHKAAEMRAQQVEESKKQQQKNRGPQQYKKRKPK